MSTTLIEKKKREREQDEAALEQNLINVLRCDSKNTTAVKRAIVARLGDPAKELLGGMFRRRGMGEEKKDSPGRGDFVTQRESLFAGSQSNTGGASPSSHSPQTREKSAGELKGIRHALIDQLSRVRSGVGKQTLVVGAQYRREKTKLELSILKHNRKFGAM